MANWNRKELLLALNLYLETPFGKQHKGYPPIISLAHKLGRTPSAVAMKLNNLTSLDPTEIERGVRGLSGASNLDRAIWEEFENDKDALVDQIEGYLEDFEPTTSAGVNENLIPRSNATESRASVKVRRQQNFFRRIVLGCYNNRCCITGNPIRGLLRASHIVPWRASEENRLNPQNGLCLSATFDVAFDTGHFTLDDDYRVLLSPTIKKWRDNREIAEIFMKREGIEIRLPEKSMPDIDLLRWHRKNIANFPTTT